MVNELVPTAPEPSRDRLDGFLFTLPGRLTPAAIFFQFSPHPSLHYNNSLHSRPQDPFFSVRLCSLILFRKTSDAVGIAKRSFDEFCLKPALPSPLEPRVTGTCVSTSPPLRDTIADNNNNPSPPANPV